MRIRRLLNYLSPRRKLPIVLQNETAECGLACLAMIASYYGGEIPLRALRQQFPSSLRGMHLGMLVDTALQMNLNARPLRLELGDLNKLKLPCILHWNFNHFVVLRQIRGRHIVIHDPQRGKRLITYPEISKAFTGVALELTPKGALHIDKKHRQLSIFDIFRGSHGLLKTTMLILGFSISLELINLTTPYFSQIVIDQIIPTRRTVLLLYLTVAFVVLAILGSAIQAIRAWLVTSATATANAQWATNIFLHLLHLPQDYFIKRFTGDIASRANSIQAMQTAITGSTVDTVVDGIMLIGYIFVLWTYSKYTGLALLGIVLLYSIIRIFSYHLLRDANEQRILASAEQQTQVFEAIRGAQTIKLFNRQGERTAMYANYANSSANAAILAQLIFSRIAFFGRSIFGVSTVVLVYVAAFKVMSGRFSIGMTFAFIAYATEFTTRSASFVDGLVNLKLLDIYAERLSDIVMTAPEENLVGRYVGEDVGSEIELCNVGFRYSQHEPWIIRGISLKFQCGDTIAITGSSGSGKSTLIKIILGLLKATEGTISIGGIDIDSYGLGRFREQIATVMQNDRLFSGNVSENISFFSQGEDPKLIANCAKSAGIEKEIEAMPMRYETLIGDMGSTLSGGQRQRLLIARALYQQPKILLLDEATSHIDAEKEKEIIDNLDALSITKIIVAHRKETLRHADVVYKLRDGNLLTSAKDNGFDNDLTKIPVG